ncbi:hypothetical protein PHAVU_005G065300 [Phaseolus vulgaris]|uniref:RING-type E3 ubiquitin transferase n=2 Tax=Phaseolus vulgaris TaxID=3885 RepID=V7BWF2_PHAVU|nr:hypothetical protein PHAVU_005G065300g [Phaseolus vulgaris]ESW21373.1 hypothetical protein PHAVU_005G065300g [Phaseolus vulgaris]
MFMDSLLSTLFFLLIVSSFSHVSSFASQPPYKDHCGSIVQESTATELTRNSFPFDDHHTGYFTGGGSIIDGGSSLYQYLTLQPIHIRATQSSDLFKVECSVSLASSMGYYYPAGNFSYGDRLRYGRQHRYRRRHVSFRLEGFWSESSGKVCMVGTGSGYSKEGKHLNLDIVFKLDNVLSVSNITILVSGSLESLSSQKDDSYFEPISVLLFPKGNYSYTLDSTEVANEFSSGSDAAKDSFSLNSLSFCSRPLSREIRRLQLEFSPECNSSKNCTPFSESSGQLPSLMSLKGIECSLADDNKHRLRVIVRFLNTSDYWIGQSFNPKAMLVGEGWWDEKKGMLCVVACHIMAKESSLGGSHVGDCSIRLRLRFPSTWSINSTSSLVGQIWSNKSSDDTSYFKRITFRNEEDGRVGIFQATKYEYSQLERVKKSCPTHKPVKNKGKRYPDVYSYDLRFDMAVIESNKRVAWGYSIPLAVGDEVSSSVNNVSSSMIDATEVKLSSGGLFNISYKISLWFNSTNVKNSLLNQSSFSGRISAEGIYDAGAGNLCMVGCRDLLSNPLIPTAHSVDCEIVVKFQLPPLDANNGIFIKGSIGSTRKNSDPLYFKTLELSSAAFYSEAAAKAVWRLDMETIMVLISTTLACVFVGLQIYHVKKHPNVLPLLSLVMMTLLTLGHMVPLVLNFEALLAQNPNNKNFVFGIVGWLEVNEIAVRLITMVAFLLQFRLLQLTWSSRKSDESNKSLWIAERKASYVTLPLYAAGLLIALLLKLKTDGEVPVITSVNQHHSSWENLKSYGGLVLDGFLLPQIILNLFSNTRENVLSCFFYFGTTFVRLLPHAYDLYRTHNYAQLDNGSYIYADPSADFYSTSWDIAIPLGGIIFAVIIYFQQRLGAHCILPQKLKGFKVYEKVPVVAESEAEVETTNL